MKLTLTLSPSCRGKPGDPAFVGVFSEAGGTIGRANDNSLILRHSKVSGRHALVTFRNGSFFIEDDSSNGTAVNNPSNRLVRNRPYALEDGDRILIEPYEIDVAVDDEDRRVAPHGDPFSGLLTETSGPAIDAGEVVDPLVLLGNRGPRSRTSIGQGPRRHRSMTCSPTSTRFRRSHPKPGAETPTRLDLRKLRPAELRLRQHASTGGPAAAPHPPPR